jgi:hypothetical protein
MIKRIMLITTCFLLLGSIASGASDWLHFIDTEKGEKCYIDLDSIKRVSPTMVMVRRKVEPHNSSNISSLVSHLEMDCSGNRLRVLKEITHYKSGKTGTAAGNSTFRKVSSADFEESLMELVCSLKKRGYRD